jgi:cell division protein FtsZ
VGGPDLKLKEMEEAASLIQQQAHEDANIIWGASIDESLGEMVKVTVIATGFDREIAQTEARSQAAQRPVMSQVPQSFASVPAARPTAPPMQSSMRPASREEMAPAFSTRRPGTTSAFQGAQSPLPIRSERFTLPSGMDSEWDTPTFQRKGQ